ncbi:MAG TPA: DUF4349 domain-containing protein [Dehalococcoidia bacterium]
MGSSFRLAGGVVFLGVVASLLAACGGSLGEGGSASAPTSSNQATAGPDQPPQTQPDSTSQQKVVVTTTLDLQVDKVADAYSSISRLARSAAGYVADSSVSGDGKSAIATARLRVPAAMHDEVVAGIKSLSAKVNRESTNAREVTDQYTDLQSQLRNLQRNEAQYQTFLAQATTIDQVLNINTRLENVRGQIEQTQGRINLLGDLSDMATINVTLSPPAAPAPQLSVGSPLHALDGAWSFSRQFALFLASAAVVLAFVVLWLLPFGVLGLGGWRFGRKLAPRARRLWE